VKLRTPYPSRRHDTSLHPIHPRSRDVLFVAGCSVRSSRTRQLEPFSDGSPSGVSLVCLNGVPRSVADRGRTQRGPTASCRSALSGGDEEPDYQRQRPSSGVAINGRYVRADVRTSVHPIAVSLADRRRWQSWPPARPRDRIYYIETTRNEVLAGCNLGETVARPAHISELLLRTIASERLTSEN